MVHRGSSCPGPQRDPWTTIMDKSLGTVLHFWGVFQFTQAQPLPSDHSTMLDLCIQNFFRVSTLYRVGRGRTARKFWKGCIVLRGNREITEKYEYCSTVPRTFVQDCRSTGVVHGPGESMFCIRPPVHVHKGLVIIYREGGWCNVKYAMLDFCWPPLLL